MLTVMIYVYLYWMKSPIELVLFFSIRIRARVPPPNTESYEVRFLHQLDACVSFPDILQPLDIFGNGSL